MHVLEAKIFTRKEKAKKGKKNENKLMFVELTTMLAN